MEETKTFSATVKLAALQEFGAIVLKMVDVFGEAETARALRASARVVASGKAK